MRNSVRVDFLGIIGQDPCDFKSNRLQVDIFQFSYMNTRYIP